jgi:hypothetical protein
MAQNIQKKTATTAISIKSVPTGTSLPLPADSNPSREHLPVPRCSNPHRAWHQGAKVPIKKKEWVQIQPKIRENEVKISES